MIDTKTTTIAEKAADSMGNDGRQFVRSDGRDLDHVCRCQHAGSVEHGTGSQTGNLRYGFPDGSAIVEAGGAWDIEGSTPWSWAGAE